ncbi:MAG TPA: hypothetical protein VLG67_04690 [Candidatus Saccharimonadales bacterium]|nr:hypothetical protein [Candidatus Saccharimonadales bacterium]
MMSERRSSMTMARPMRLAGHINRGFRPEIVSGINMAPKTSIKPKSIGPNRPFTLNDAVHLSPSVEFKKLSGLDLKNLKDFPLAENLPKSNMSIQNTQPSHAVEIFSASNPTEGNNRHNHRRRPNRVSKAHRPASYDAGSLKNTEIIKPVNIEQATIPETILNSSKPISTDSQVNDTQIEPKISEHSISSTLEASSLSDKPKADELAYVFPLEISRPQASTVPYLLPEVKTQEVKIPLIKEPEIEHLQEVVNKLKTEKIATPVNIPKREMVAVRPIEKPRIVTKLAAQPVVNAEFSQKSVLSSELTPIAVEQAVKIVTTKAKAETAVVNSVNKPTISTAEKPAPIISSKSKKTGIWEKAKFKAKEYLVFSKNFALQLKSRFAEKRNFKKKKAIVDKNANAARYDAIENIKNILLNRNVTDGKISSWNEAVKLLPEEAPEPMVSGILKSVVDNKKILGNDKSWKLVKKVLNKMGYISQSQKTETVLKLIPAVEIGESGEPVTLQDVLNVVGQNSFDIAS